MAPEGPGDGDLVRAFLSGDEGAFVELMRRHEDRIFALAYRITGDREDALEATQETFISLFRRAASFKGEAELGTWLYRIGINASRDVLRKRKRFPLSDQDEEAFASPSGSPTTEEQAIQRTDLTRALAAIPKDYRDAVVMHDVGGIPYEEIALSSGVALGTVKSRISRGRRLLAQRLEQPRDAGTSKNSR